MKSLYLLRHGKSDWGADFFYDVDRPLAKRGRNAADRLGRYFAITDNSLDRTVTSPAVRALRTADRFLEASGSKAPMTIDDRLYGGDETTVLEVASEQANSVHSLLLVGHEPTWSETASLLIGGGDLRFPTAALARIDLHINEWGEIGRDVGELVWFVTPRLLKPLLKRS
ncbi:MAG: histidine phosphatase family protein [Bacteroidota bacterium]